MDTLTNLELNLFLHHSPIPSQDGTLGILYAHHSLMSMPHERVYSHSTVVYILVEKSGVYPELRRQSTLSKETLFWLGERSGEVTEGSDGDNFKNEVLVHAL